MMRLSIALVLYRSDQAVLARTLSALNDAVRASGVAASLWLIDNHDKHHPSEAAMLAEQIRASVAPVYQQVTVLEGHGNLGFGRGHNLVIDRIDSDLHLILNPDAVMQPDVIKIGIEYLEQHKEVILLAPSVYDENGAMQYLCRRYPSLLDLLLRGFAPRVVRRLFKRRLECYEMRDCIDSEHVYLDPLIVSGSFMLIRTSAFRQLNGFDPAYFLYFEDYDLSLRSHVLGRIAYVPQMRIVHLGGDAARKGFRHIRMFLDSAAIFFGRHGLRIF